MAKTKTMLSSGTLVKIKGTENGKLTLLNQQYTVVEQIDPQSVKIKDSLGHTFNVHTSRIKIEEPIIEKETPVNTEIVEDQKEEEVKKEEPKKEEPKKVEEDKKPKATPKTVKTKKEKTIIPFDVEKWADEHGGILLRKKCEFNHVKTHQLIAHVAVDAENGYYYLANVYVYPNGVHSLGKKSKQPEKYALKGKRVTKTVTVDKETGATDKRVQKGKETAAELVYRMTNANAKKRYELVRGKIDLSSVEAKKFPKGKQ